MITSEYKSYDELPLFLNAKLVAQVLGVSPIQQMIPPVKNAFTM